MLGTSSAVAVVNGSEMLRNSKQHFFSVSRACFAEVCSAVDFRSLAEVALPLL